MRYSSPELLNNLNISDKWQIGRCTFKADYLTLTSTDDFGGKKAYWITVTNEKDGWAQLKIPSERLVIEPNIDYTISFKSHIGKNCKGIKLVLFNSGDSKQLKIYEKTKDSTSAGIRNHDKVTFKNTLDEKAYLCIYNMGKVDTASGSYDSNLLIRDIQIEKGNKVSDWTPAPEDIDHAISSVDSKVTTTSNKVATIETNLSGITQRVSSTESTISTHTTQLGTVDSRINTAKNSAISTAASDATTKANNAQNKALADAKNYTNGQITTVTETINSRVAEIKATTDGITQKVSANETKVNTITTNFNNLQIGGRNYIVATKVGCYSSYNTINTSTSGYIKSTWNANWTGNTFTINVAGFSPKKAIYTMSGIIKVNGSIPTAKYFTGYASTYGNNLIRNDYDATTGKFVITQSYPGNSSWLFHATTTRTSKSTDVVELFNLKFEEGNKATD